MQESPRASSRIQYFIRFYKEIQENSSFLQKIIRENKTQIGNKRNY